MYEDILIAKNEILNVSLTNMLLPSNHLKPQIGFTYLKVKMLK